MTWQQIQYVLDTQSMMLEVQLQGLLIGEQNMKPNGLNPDDPFVMGMVGLNYVKEMNKA